MSEPSRLLSGRTALVLGSVLLGLAYLMPGHYPPWTSFESQLVAALGFVLIVAAACRARVPLHPLAALAAVVAVIPVLQYATGLIAFHADAVMATFYLLAFGLVVTAGVALQKRELELRQLVGWALVGSAALSSGLALSQWLDVYVLPLTVPLVRGARPFGNLAQPNHLATLLVLGMVFLHDLFQRRRLGAGVATLLFAWLGLGLALTQSRTGFLALAILAAWFVWQRRRLQLRAWPLVVVAGLAGVVALGLAVEPLSKLMGLAGEGSAERLRAGTRPVHWASMWQAAWERPLWGWGWGQVSHAQQAVALDHRATAEMLHSSHNIVLDLMVWNGALPGLAIALAVLAWFGSRVRRLDDLAAVTWAAVVVVIGVHALLEYPLDYLYFLLPWGLAIGLLHRPAGPGAGRLAALKVPPAALAGCLVLLGAVGAWVASDYVRIETAAREVRLQAFGVHGGTPRTEPAPPVILLDGLREFHALAISSARPGMTPAELDWVRKVADRYPVPTLMARRALAAGLNGHPEEAVLTLQRLCRLHVETRCTEAQAAWDAARLKWPQLPPVVLAQP